MARGPRRFLLLLLAGVLPFLQAPLGAETPPPVLPPAGPVELPPDSIQIPLGAGLDVFFVNVGQGDAEFIRLPDGKTALIDGGPTQKALSQFLKDHGVTRIDYVVLTHPHADHYRGLKYVFKNLEVGTFYDTAIDNSDVTGDNALRELAASKSGVRTVYPRPGDSLDWSAGVGVKVFNSCPDAKASPDGPDINNCSIVLKMTYQNASVLLVGDAQEEAEARMVREYGDELKADVLKVGHHGSGYSSSAAFLEKVRPQKAFIEVGKNSYGHPTAAALERLRAAGAFVYRSDVDGTQEYAVGGRPELQVSTGPMQTSALPHSLSLLEGFRGF